MDAVAPTAYLTAGVGRASYSTGALNVGGGVALWGRGGDAIRLETRAHWFTYGPCCSDQFLEFRVGWNFGRR